MKVSSNLQRGVELLGERQQRGAIDQIDLVQHQHLRRPAFAQRVQDLLRLLAQEHGGAGGGFLASRSLRADLDLLPRVDQQRQTRRRPPPRPRPRPPWRDRAGASARKSRRVDEDDLRRAFDHDAAHGRARRLRLARNDGDFGADERIDQRRFAGVRRADQSDEAAGMSRSCALILSCRHRAMKACAAACSAARLEDAEPCEGSKPSRRDLHRELRRVRRPGATDLDIDRRVERARLRPFLHRGLGVARRARRPRACARATSARRVRCAASKPASTKTAPISNSQMSARIASFLRPPACASPTPSTTCGPTSHSLGDFSAGLAPHQSGEPHRQLAFARLRIGFVEHLRDSQTENAIAQELQALIGIEPALPRRRRRGKMGQRAGGQFGIAKPIANSDFEISQRGLLLPGHLADRLEQATPAHGPRPAPDLPRRLAVLHREEDHLGPADEIVERHEADAALVGGNA